VLEGREELCDADEDVLFFRSYDEESTECVGAGAAAAAPIAMSSAEAPAVELSKRRVFMIPVPSRCQLA
jgi:hypothetical protein